ncbi:hypothetical protein NHX12_003936 [Muraenolepis orangiensis]|uniref:Protein kinase domain-containing protein n=1 Tax=Muraenolepis orangiensis TaxID=630683 RepID=A0A9Q0DU99_9TELE|nr:hypothetical protein NHX12_003936 [Muraenolepis orangiensis]
MSSKPLRAPATAAVGDGNHAGMDLMQRHIESLSTKMDRLIHIQEKVLSRLDGMSQDIDGIERDVENMKVDHEEPSSPPPPPQTTTTTPEEETAAKPGQTGEVREMCQEMSSIMTVVNQRSEQQAEKLEGMEKLVLGIQQAISFIGETVKGSHIMELMFKGPAARKSAKVRDSKGKMALKRQTSTDAVSKKADKLKDPKGKEAKEKQCLSLKSVKTQKKRPPDTTDPHSLRNQVLLEEVETTNEENTEKSEPQEQAVAVVAMAADSSVEPRSGASSPATGALPPTGAGKPKLKRDGGKQEAGGLGATKDAKKVSLSFCAETPAPKDAIPARKNDPSALWSISGDHKEAEKSPEATAHRSSEPRKDVDAGDPAKNNSPPPAAPFLHRVVAAKPNQIINFYTINHQEILGGSTNVIKAKTQKEKEVVKNEIQVMNQLDHSNLIQLYAAYESRNDMILVLELQICEGLQHMHRMYILHLDLKPENILCVSRVTNKVKIIDFGLARIYKPREKLKVNFGTPEFLAPEIVNYDFVSFNTDMWSLGVITYMLLSGLCPFLGDDDGQTMNNILEAKWDFEEEEFITVSSEAKDFITKLLVVNKSWRIGASQALKHPWLSDPVLHHRLFTKRTMCKSRRASCIPVSD